MCQGKEEKSLKQFLIFRKIFWVSLDTSVIPKIKCLFIWKAERQKPRGECEWQGPKYISHHLLPPWMNTGKKLELVAQLGLKTQALQYGMLNQTPIPEHLFCPECSDDNIFRRNLAIFNHLRHPRWGFYKWNCFEIHISKDC